MCRISVLFPRLVPAAAILLLLAQSAYSSTPWSLAEIREEQSVSGPIIGRNIPYVIGKEDTLVDLARRTKLGYLGLARANKEVDPWLPEPGREILLPYAAILPEGALPGITINLAELRLYHIREYEGVLRIRHYPVGIGSEGWETPEGSFVVTEKIRDPSWTVPAAIRSENPSLPASVPPGPENPLGSHWLGFSEPGYGIHGTNRSFGVGRRVSHGCLRLYPEDIRELYNQVDVGTRVRIVYQPVKVGRTEDALLVEMHPDILGRVEDPLAEVVLKAETLGWKGSVNLQMLAEILQDSRGIPMTVSRESEGAVEASLGAN